MKRLKKLLISTITIYSILLPLNIAKSQEKIEIISLLKTTKGLDGKKISYPRWKQAELRLFKVIIPVGQKTPLHIHPAPMIVYIAKGELKHTRGENISYFSEKQSLVESNYGEEHFVENVGKNEAILFVAVSSVVGMPTTINK